MDPKTARRAAELDDKIRDLTILIENMEGRYKECTVDETVFDWQKGYGHFELKAVGRNQVRPLIIAAKRKLNDLQQEMEKL
jgi:hypothetical protein